MPTAIKPIEELSESDKRLFWSGVDQKRKMECWNWMGRRDKHDYGEVRFGFDKFFAHRIAWFVTNGEIPNEKPFVLHRCDNPRCCNPSHLFLGTQSENMADMRKKGREARGEKHGWILHPECVPKGESHYRSRLTERDVCEIRRRYKAGGITHQQLADEYGIQRRAIGKIITRTNWKSL